MVPRLSRTDRASLPTRRPEAGVTLVEMLVVLVLIGIVAGVVGLSIGATDRTSAVRTEADLLTARMARATEEIVIEGRPIAFVWSAREYRFDALGKDGWAPHPVPVLGKAKALGSGARFLGEATSGGTFVITASALPESGGALALSLGPVAEVAGARVEVTWDGVTARVSEDSP